MEKPKFKVGDTVILIDNNRCSKYQLGTKAKVLSIEYDMDEYFCNVDWVYDEGDNLFVSRFKKASWKEQYEKN